MIGSAELPELARVFAALGGLAGLRLGAITHTTGKGLCADVSKLRVSPKDTGRVVRLATRLAPGGGTYCGSAMMIVEAPGVEPGSENAFD